MKTVLRMTSSLWDELKSDLHRPHPFAYERVCFLTAKPAVIKDGILLLANRVHSIADDDYIESKNVGALLGAAAFRKILQYAFANSVSIFHTHDHGHRGKPQFSQIDLRESAKFVPDFFKVRPAFPHGAVVLSDDNINGLIWRTRETSPSSFDTCAIVGTVIREFRGDFE